MSINFLGSKAKEAMTVERDVPRVVDEIFWELFKYHQENGARGFMPPPPEEAEEILATEILPQFPPAIQEELLGGCVCTLPPDGCSEEERAAYRTLGRTAIYYTLLGYPPVNMSLPLEETLSLSQAPGWMRERKLPPGFDGMNFEERCFMFGFLQNGDQEQDKGEM
ncbi:MAG: hypothetical protein U9M98_02240 [Patescibacteria group bacterium]|nr:hypothetical protein [Patescibacteria group bacterium]